MARHIDADQMIADTEAMKQVCEAIEIDGIIKYIEEHIAADVEEVKHGKWLFVIGNCREEIWMCNQCERCIRAERMEKDELIKRYPYCHCGAKMDEKE